MKQISIVGLGYIGLPTGILAAQKGYKVFGYDIDEQKLERISKGDPTIVEPEIIHRLYEVLQNKNFQVSFELKKSDCFIISVPTPFKLNSKNKIKQADLSFVFDAAKAVAKVLAPGNLVILESTIPVGTTSDVAKFLEQKSGLKLGLDFFVAHCPERVLPGKIFEELVTNDRVIGAVCDGSAQLAKKFYSKFVKGELYFTDDKTAEMVKLVENSSRDVSIAFANQVASMAQKAGINPSEVINIANKHPRVNILNPGCGVGGHCIAVDPWFLIETFPEETELLKIARKVNNKKPEQVIKKVLDCAEKIKNNKNEKAKVFVLGLAFKPNVDDLRESPALNIAAKLKSKKSVLDLAVCEPNIVSDKLKSIGFNNVMGLLEGVRWADLILVLVKHNEFLVLKDLVLDDHLIIDICGLLNKSKETKNNYAFFNTGGVGELNL